MKKVATIALVLTIAGSAMAAQINWQTPGGFQYAVSSGSVVLPVGDVVQLVYVGAADEGVGIGGIVQGDDVVVAAGAIGDNVSAPLKGRFGETFNYTYNAGDPTAKNGANYVIRIFDTGKVNYVDVAGFAITATDNLGTDTFNIPGLTSAGWSAVPVPEPTSMALFGLGVGVLALRRRFQKKA